MNREQLTTLFKACSHLKAKKNTYNVTEGAVVDLLLDAGSNGPAPLTKVKSVTLNDDYVKVATEEHNYLLPLASVFGLKWAEKGDVRASRTGFHA